MSRGNGGTPRQEPGRNQTHQLFAVRLKGTFRNAASYLTCRVRSLGTGVRRGRAGETIRVFRRAAAGLLRPALGLPVVSQATVFFQDALAWLHLWHGNNSSNTYDADSNSRVSEDNHLSPRL